MMIKIKSDYTRQIILKFEDFFKTQMYGNQIKFILNRGGKTFIFLYEDLMKFDSRIAKLLKNMQENTLELAEKALKNILKGYLREKMTDKEYFVCVTTKDEKCPLRVGFNDFRTKNLGKLLIFDGRVIYCARSELNPKEANYIQTQRITLQEIQKHTSCMTHKRNIWVMISEDMVDTVKKGQKLRLTGTLEVDLSKIKKNQGFSNFFIKANYISKL